MPFIIGGQPCLSGLESISPASVLEDESSGGAGVRMEARAWWKWGLSPCELHTHLPCHLVSQESLAIAGLQAMCSKCSKESHLSSEHVAPALRRVSPQPSRYQLGVPLCAITQLRV